MTRDATPDPDARSLAALAHELPAIDLEATTAQQIARRARGEVGKGPPKRRWAWPIVVAVVAGSCAVFVASKLLEVFG